MSVRIIVDKNAYENVLLEFKIIPNKVLKTAKTMEAIFVTRPDNLPAFL